jgi:hypothetical protein
VNLRSTNTAQSPPKQKNPINGDSGTLLSRN